jgi:hypothetical protein
MDEYESAQRRSDAALARLREAFDEAVEAFHRLEAVHRQGNRTREAGDEFREKARHVHEDAQEARAAQAALRRFFPR